MTNAMRPSWEETYIEIAETLAKRSTCIRRSVGAVITDNRNVVLGMGYNGPPRTHQHCTEVPCLGASSSSGTDLDLCDGVHAEVNAILHCRELDKAHTIYTTTFPCVSCFKMIANSGIERVIYRHPYKNHFKAVMDLNNGLRSPLKFLRAV